MKLMFSGNQLLHTGRVRVRVGVRVRVRVGVRVGTCAHADM